MNHFTYFGLVFAMYYRFGTACKSNIIEITNRLGPGILLQYHCTKPSSGNDHDDGNKELSFNKTHTIKFREVLLVNFRRIQYRCKLRYGKYSHDLEVYRSAATRRCGQRRLWTAKKDGIYFRRGYNKPSEFERNWNFVP